ncbi:hypothetical protein GA0070616_4604 [Micromonospora nigra]|uniref:Uncharacterized protein n=1 Tax=Micromonospora nigra TaxID=145857 RepID=A0A1C6SUC6_9ACTN|nr:hypothetical protein [Micromonospora nigra]SCL32979.1 hypothetical protein GA0070616_4604 [Micromonospora nigra]
MTRAPSNLLAVRRLLLDHLNVDTSRVRTDDLEPAEVGIVGDADHRGGYHCGEDRVVRNDYSVVESSRDRVGLSDFASALDVGSFSYRDALGRTHTLHTFSVWLVKQCAAGTADTRDVREVIYSPDGKVVRRWDRLGRRTSGDSSHLWHTHISFFRDATRAGRDLTPVFRRYLVHIGAIKGAPDMDTTQARQLAEVHAALPLIKAVHAALTRLDGREPIGQAYLRLAVGRDHAANAQPVMHPTLTSLAAQLDEVQAQLRQPAPVVVDAAQVAAALAGDEGFRSALAQAVNDDHARRMSA